jgi:hypothetical protein
MVCIGMCTNPSQSCTSCATRTMDICIRKSVAADVAVIDALERIPMVIHNNESRRRRGLFIISSMSSCRRSTKNPENDPFRIVLESTIAIRHQSSR